MGQATSLAKEINKWLEQLEVGLEDGFAGSPRSGVDPGPSNTLSNTSKDRKRCPDRSKGFDEVLRPVDLACIWESAILINPYPKSIQQILMPPVDQFGNTKAVSCFTAARAGPTIAAPLPRTETRKRSRGLRQRSAPPALRQSTIEALPVYRTFGTFQRS